MSMAFEFQTERAQTPAYVPYMTFKNFVGMLKEHGVPSHVDKSVMTHLAGGTQSHLTSALKFLGLTKSDQTPTWELNQLVSAYDTETWPEVISATINQAYADVVGKMDLNSATPYQLDKCFESDSDSAAMIDKCVRFYLSALDDAKISYSSHLKKRKPRATRRLRSNGKSKEVPKPTQASSEPLAVQMPAKESPLSNGMIMYPIHFSNDRVGKIEVPRDIDEEDCEMIELLIPMLKMLAKRNAGS